jgi:hypothetical protein
VIILISFCSEELFEKFPDVIIVGLGVEMEILCITKKGVELIGDTGT